MRILLTIISCLLLLRPAAQVIDAAVVELADLHHFDSSNKKYAFVSTPKNTVADAAIPSLFQSAKPRRQGPVPDSLMERDCFVRFILHNNSDTVREVYFVAGYYLHTLQLYKADPGNVEGSFQALFDNTPARTFADSRLITVQPHETAVYYARFNFIRTNINSYLPRVVDKEFIWAWGMMIRSGDGFLNTITYLVCGMMLLMIFYSLAVYAQNHNTEFLFYAGYATCTVAMVFMKAFLLYRPSPLNSFNEEYLDFMILCAGVFFYLGFIRKFLNTGVKEPFLEKTLRYSEFALLVLLAAFSSIYFFTDKYIVLHLLENYVIKLLIFLIGILVIVYSIRKKDPLLRYLAAGNIAWLVFSMISLGIIVFKWRFYPASPSSVLNRSMLYYEAGLVFELTLFLFGLAYKNRKDIIAQVKEREELKRENERKEFEKQMAMMAVRQEERDRISADMHDDLGSGVTAIRLMSEIVKSKMKPGQYPEIDKISQSANELLGKMNAIIWTMKSSNDTIESLVAYLRAYATEFFDNTPVACVIDVQEITDHEISGEKRRNIFLCFKETLNNVLKHANATRVDIRISVQEEKLLIGIHDNGVGINLKSIRRFGNGLNNIKKRVQSNQGELMIGNSNGTLVCFEFRVAQTDLSGD